MSEIRGTPPAPDAPAGDRVQRATTLELFFDLVFVFTLTQLTGLLEHDVTIETGIRVVLILTVLYGMYSGYVWLTNQVPPTTLTTRLLILAAMAGLLVSALAIPHAFDRDGVAFAIGFLVVVLVHGGLFAHVYGRAVLGILTVNVLGALAILVAGVVGGALAPVLWLVTIGLGFVSHWLGSGSGSGRLLASGFVLRPVHFVERHGLLLIVAFGESVVAIGIGLGEVEFDVLEYVAAVLGLVLVSALWWTYFAGDDERALEALRAAPDERRLAMASNAFSYAFLPMLLGIVTLAAGVALTIDEVDLPAAIEPAILLGGGAALYLIGDVLFRWALGVEPIRKRISAVPVLLATIAVGLAVSGLAQLVALIATLVLVLVLEGRARPPASAIVEAPASG